MDLLDLLKLMFRRWYVSVPIVVVTLGAALAFGLAIQPEYKTEVAILLVPPTTSAAPEPDAAPRPGNPWLRIGENAMAQAVQISTSAHDARTRIAAAGGDPDYEVGLVTRSSILTIAVTASSEESARKTVEAVTQLVHDEVAGQQAPYRPNPGEQITTEVLDPGLNILPSRSNVLRAQVVILAIGILLAAVAAVVHDAVARRRANARLGVRRDAPTPMAWNGGSAVTAGQAVVGRPRPGPAVAPSPVARTAPISPAPTPRGAAVPAGREPTQAVSRRAARGPEDRTPAHQAHDRHPDPQADDRYAGPSVDDRAATPTAEETVLLGSTARKVLDDPGR
ncbi:hypothetical protein [Plantactinospora sp. WMMB782]|uniref:hypothetical protein n=1 Tax=Plantactinospora sp. WMMB782 TaxID=3404121 RepID=UPI003B94565B